MCAVNNRDAIALFIAQYRQCVEPRSLSFPPSDVLIKADVQRILHREMFEDAATQYLPSESYRGRVLKVLLQKLENAIKDPDEDVCCPLVLVFSLSYHTSCAFFFFLLFSLMIVARRLVDHANLFTRILPLLCAFAFFLASHRVQEVLENFYFYWGDLVSKPISSQELSHVRYTMPLHPGLSRANKGEPGGADDDHGDDDREDISSRSVLTLENRSLIFASGTTGFRTWEAALHLATYLTSDAATSDSGSNIGSGRGNSKVAGKSIIELGCGTGFLSMYCAKCLGARYVAATDMQESLIDGLRRCSALNDIAESKMTAAVWTWGEELPRLDGRVDDDGWRESHHAKEEQATATGEFDIGIGADLVRPSRQQGVFNTIIAHLEPKEEYSANYRHFLDLRSGHHPFSGLRAV